MNETPQGTVAMERKQISCFKGLAPVSMPGEWLNGFDTLHGFAFEAGEAFIRFPAIGVFGIRVEHNGPDVQRFARRLTEAEIPLHSYGPFCAPWEPYAVSKAFGHGPVTRLDDV